MSKLYDDLRREGETNPSDDRDSLDLFSFAQSKYGPSPDSPSEPQPEPANVPLEEPAEDRLDEPPKVASEAFEPPVENGARAEPPEVPEPSEPPELPGEPVPPVSDEALEPPPPLPETPLPETPLPESPLQVETADLPPDDERPRAPRFEGALYNGMSPLTAIGQRGRPRPGLSPSTFAIAVVCAVVALGILAFSVMRVISVARMGKTVAEWKAEAARSVEPAARPPVPPAPAPIPPAPQMAAKPKSPAAAPAPAAPKAPERPRPSMTAAELKLDIPGARVSLDGGEKVIVFDEGLFASGYALSAEGKAILDRVAQQILPYRKNNLFITVVGCTDNIPIRQKREYKDNDDLGLFRAHAVVEHLQPKSGLPTTSFKMITYGTKWSPYPNDTADNRARNRTVVLRIAPR